MPSKKASEGIEAEVEEESGAGAYKLNPRLTAHQSAEIAGVVFTHDEPVELTDAQVAEVKGVKVSHFGEMVTAVVKA